MGLNDEIILSVCKIARPYQSGKLVINPSKKQWFQFEGELWQRDYACRPTTSWWLNQPIWKICSSKWMISPGIRDFKFSESKDRYFFGKSRKNLILTQADRQVQGLHTSESRSALALQFKPWRTVIHRLKAWHHVRRFDRVWYKSEFPQRPWSNFTWYSLKYTNIMGNCQMSIFLKL